MAPELWFNTVVGLLLLYMGWRFALWALATVTGQPFHTAVTFTDTGLEVPYFQLQGYSAWTEAGMFLFGLTVLFEVAVMAMRPIKALVLVALFLCVISTAWNLVVCAMLMRAGMLPLMSGLAVAFGGWIVANLWQKMPRT